MNNLVIDDVGYGIDAKERIKKLKIQVTDYFVKAPKIAMEEKLPDHGNGGMRLEIGQNREIIQGEKNIGSNREEKVKRRNRQEEDNHPLYNSGYAKETNNYYAGI